MDNFKLLARATSVRIWLSTVLLVTIVLAIGIAAQYQGIGNITIIAICFVVTLLLGGLFSRMLTTMALQPLADLRQAILHVSQGSTNLPAPDLQKIKRGRELVSSLALAVYDMASKVQQEKVVESAVGFAETDKVQLLNEIPLPLFAINSKNGLQSVNNAALDYLGIDKARRGEYIGKNINDILNMAFPSDITYETWLSDCQNNVVTANTVWNRVRLIDAEGKSLKQFDLAASYNKGNDIESVLVMFDRTSAYNADDQEISFVAMAVHELRTPLTIMRGYIEVFEDELGPTLNPELKDFMFKMHASAQQLAAFVSNILNVARIEENQLTLTLHQEDIGQILTSAVADLELRARVHNRHIELVIAPDLPKVAADRISVHEVINNLVDNAIKYSDKSEKIIVTAVIGDTKMIEVSVQDFGAGIPESVVPKLFDKFYRSHRSRSSIGGTGLGLFLCKAIVGAHGGNIWVKSHEGQGSIFTFTLEPYDETRHGAEAQGQDGIMRGAHGWIKNHSMYRR